MLKHYVQFFYPGLFVSDDSTTGIDKRDLSEVNVPKNCFAFRFFDRTESKVDGEWLVGEKKNFSKTYYVEAEAWRISDIKGSEHDTGFLVSNLTRNKNMAGVRCRSGNWQSLEKGDHIVEVNAIGRVISDKEFKSEKDVEKRAK